MKVQQNISLFAGEKQRTGSAENVRSKGNQEARKEEGGNIFAGNLNLLQDRIAQKRQEAQKKAMKVVNDAWGGDRAIDNDLNERRERVRTLRQEMGDAQKELGSLKAQRKELQEEYGITDDSQEQKDLELLVKRHNAGQPGSEIRLTEEDQERLAEIDKEGMTSYQERSLAMHQAGDMYREIVSQNTSAIAEETAIIQGVRKERLKSAPMVEAKEEAEAIQEAASKEIIGMVVEESKEHIEEEQKKREEEAEKIKEEKEKMEELLEKRKEEKEKAEGTPEDIPAEELTDLEQVKSDVRQQVQEIVNKMNLVTEDIKGAMVDQTV